MANRGVSWDPSVHTIEDLKQHGSAKLPKMYRGTKHDYKLWDIESHTLICRLL